MTVRELFEKYCKKTDDGEYIVRGHCFALNPASKDELECFKKLCLEFNVEQHIIEELSDYYSQTNSFFDYFLCTDRSLFEWWEDNGQKSIWLGCLDDDCFIYDDIDHKYAIGFSGNKDLGEYDSLMDMLESYLKEGFENGWNE